jgi:MFS-type transporter involved in bile tolerance (Atg22 family)
MRQVIRERVKGTVSRDFPAQTAYIIHLQITSLFMDKKDFASFCKLAEIFAFLSHSLLSGTALSASWALSRTALSETGRCPGQL